MGQHASSCCRSYVNSSLDHSTNLVLVCHLCVLITWSQSIRWEFVFSNNLKQNAGLDGLLDSDLLKRFWYYWWLQRLKFLPPPAPTWDGSAIGSSRLLLSCKLILVNMWLGGYFPRKTYILVPVAGRNSLDSVFTLLCMVFRIALQSCCKR